MARVKPDGIDAAALFYEGRPAVAAWLEGEKVWPPEPDLPGAIAARGRSRSAGLAGLHAGRVLAARGTSRSGGLAAPGVLRALSARAASRSAAIAALSVIGEPASEPFSEFPSEGEAVMIAARAISISAATGDVAAVRAIAASLRSESAALAAIAAARILSGASLSRSAAHALAAVERAIAGRASSRSAALAGAHLLRPLAALGASHSAGAAGGILARAIAARGASQSAAFAGAVADRLIVAAAASRSAAAGDIAAARVLSGLGASLSAGAAAAGVLRALSARATSMSAGVAAAERGFTEDFGGHAVASGMPTGFTQRWVTTNISYAIQNEAISGSVSGKEFKLTSTTNSRRAISFNAPGNADADMDVVVGVYVAGNASVNAAHAGAAARIGGGAGSETAYVARLWTIGSARNTFGVTKYVAGSATSVAEASFSWEVNTRYFIRLRTIGTSIRARIWAAGGSEPGTWNIDATDSDIGGSGYAGFFDFRSEGSPAFDWISVGLGNNVAILPP